MHENKAYWDGVPSKDDERELIKHKAECFVDKTGFSPATKQARTGYARRSQKDISQVMVQLAELQHQYDQQPHSSNRRIAFRAMLLVYPLLGADQHTRSDNWLNYGSPILFASQRVQAFSAGFPIPLITVRFRQKSEKIDAGERDKENLQEIRAEAIGGAVVAEYRRMKDEGSPNLEAAWSKIAEAKYIGGFETLSAASVRRHYKSFRRLAFVRGFADSRALTAQLLNDAWPKDQIWLSDFPQNFDG
jgi:hypothetical protein